MAVFGGGSDACTQNIDVEGLTHPSALIWRAIVSDRGRRHTFEPPGGKVGSASKGVGVCHRPFPTFYHGQAPRWDRTASEAAAKKSCVRAGESLPTFSPLFCDRLFFCEACLDPPASTASLLCWVRRGRMRFECISVVCYTWGTGRPRAVTSSQRGTGSSVVRRLIRRHVAKNEKACYCSL